MMIRVIFLVSLLSISIKVFSTQQQNFNVINSKDTTDFLLKKFNAGIDFFATGNEPFWSLDIAMNQFIHFNTLNGVSINLSSVNGERAMDANVMRFVSGSPEGLFTVTISENECTDNMSGEKFSYKVIVELNNYGDKNYKIFEGCGRYVPNYTLNRKWKVKKIREQEITESPGMKKLPELNFDVEKMRFSGNAGCNNVMGGLFLEFNKIRFINPASTMMMCENMEIEKNFLDALSKTVYFKILGNQLMLSNPDSMLMVLYAPDMELRERSELTEDTSRAYRLNDIWVLVNINGADADKSNYTKGLPYIEINISEKRISGNGGCNNINGSFDVNGENISFGPIASTRMMCPGNFETDFLTALSNSNSYRIENNRLYLLQDGKEILIFKKTD